MLWLGIVLPMSGMGVLFVAVGAGLLLHSWWLVRGGLRADGTVTELVEDATDGQDSPMVTFSPVHGGPVTFRVKFADGSLQLGDRVPVLYAAGNPRRAVVEQGKHLWLAPLFFVIPGLALCGAGVTASVFGLWSGF
jgi:hypothetical protein